MLCALARLAGPADQVEIYDGVGALPHFNPDFDQEGMGLPASVAQLRRMIAVADGLVISSPEYAHGVPGALKNALDWLVSGPEMVYKPIGLLNPSPRSVHAHASLAETLRTMSTTLVDGACIVLPIAGADSTRTEFSPTRSCGRGSTASSPRCAPRQPDQSTHRLIQGRRRCKTSKPQRASALL